MCGRRQGHAALRKAREALGKLERRAASGRIQREALESQVQKTLQREHLSEFVVTTVKEQGGKVSLHWHVDAARRRLLERTRLGRRVLTELWRAIPARRNDHDILVWNRPSTR
jgi:hypothetical protein